MLGVSVLKSVHTRFPISRVHCKLQSPRRTKYSPYVGSG